MNVSREAEAEPASPADAVSEKVASTRSTGTPTASAAICRKAVWLPCPTSAPAWNSSTWSTSSSPWRTSRASQRSGKPNEKPTFLNPQAKPRPRRSAPGCGGRDAKGEGASAGGRGSVQWAASAQRSTTTGRLTPGGISVPVGPMDPSRSRLRRRSSTGSMPRRSASLFIWVSATNAPCGAPKPRKAPPGTAWVSTAKLSTARWGIS